MSQHTHRDILDALGDYRVIAGNLDVSPSAVSTWKTKGIPAGRWVAIRRLAVGRKLHWITVEHLAETAPVLVDAGDTRRRS